MSLEQLARCKTSSRWWIHSAAVIMTGVIFRFTSSMWRACQAGIPTTHLLGQTSLMTSPGPPTTPLSFPTIVEKVEEEERAAEETARCPPSPLAHYYSSLTLSDRYAWPAFLGDWACEDSCQPRRVSTGCLDESREEVEGEEGRALHRQLEENYAKDDLAVGRTTLAHAVQPLLHRDAFDVRHVTVRKRNSVCDIEFRFPLLPSVCDSALGACDSLPAARLQRPFDLPLSPSSSCTPSVSARTSQGSIPDWEIVARRHSCVHITGQEWVFFICLFVFVSLCLGISIHNFVFILLGLQTMYYLLLSLV